MDFDQYSKGYDTEPRAKRAEIIADKIKSFIIDGRKKSAMEYGCGTGLVGMHLVDEFCSMLFMDSSQGMIHEVEKKIATIPHASAFNGDLMKTLPDNLHLDYIFSSMVLHHIKDTKTILSQFFGLLNREGRLLIVDLDKDDGRFHASEAGFDGHDGFDQAELNDLLVETGFQKVEICTFYNSEREINGVLANYSLFIAKADKT